MRLTIPEPKIKLYEDGFDKHDKLSRKPTGDKLSDLIERIDDPLVIALDGAWGSGKSLFLKCWVGEHLKRRENTTQTVYFDAFKHDYLDDPLVALTGAIADRFRNQKDEQQEQDQTRIHNLKKTAWAVSKAAGRIGLSAVTFGATEVLSDLGDEIAKAAGEEAKAFLDRATGNEQANHFWDAHQAKIAAMEAFRLALTELTEPKATENREDRPSKKLVVVVDELDRCRPDYALSLLEIIKHFFNVNGVHFILGTNLEELKNSVRARYGHRIDATTYLHKFCSVVLKLPTNVDYSSEKIIYLNFASSQMQIPIPMHETVRSYLDRYHGEIPMTLRTIQRILSVLALVSSRQADSGHREFVVAAAFLKVCSPNTYEKMKNNILTIEDLKEVFHLDQYDIACWKSVLSAALGNNETYAQTQRLIPQTLLPDLCEECLETFSPVGLLNG
ncbi:KAP family P-loop NTPase fold protein [Ruegeria arenilitoris]|uniref:KAP family P-loop NTPase fold protein n=1 Tax=Ruegeria arenilitoris TaxID=1173585 RepID=UPI00147E329F|nr:P-loop NTPase fold protein [Ruegeria arenilitoris]